jgi:hypothetical protein
MPRENPNEINDFCAQAQNSLSAFADKKSTQNTKPPVAADLRRPQIQTNRKDAHGQARPACRWLKARGP